MALSYAVTNFAARSGTGTQAVAHGLGTTPQAAIIFGSYATSNTGSVHDQSGLLFLGWYDGTNYAAASAQFWDQYGSTNTHSNYDTDEIIQVIQSQDSTTDEANVSSWDGTNVTLNWALRGDNTLWQCVLVTMDGLDMAESDSTNVANDSTTTTAQEADAVIAMTVHRTPPGSGFIDDTGGLSIGFVENDGSTYPLLGAQFHARTARPSGEPQGALSWGVATDTLGAVGGWYNGSVDLHNIDAFSASNFTWNQAKGSGTTNGVGTLSLAMPAGKAISIGKETSPNSTGNQGYTGVGFKPGLVIFLYTNRDAEDTEATNTYSGTFAGGIGLGATDGTNTWTVSTHDDNNNGTPDPGSVCDSLAIKILLDDGSGVDSEADFVSFDSDGFTLNWTTADATTNYQWGYIAFEEEGVAGPATAVKDVLGGGLIPTAR